MFATADRPVRIVSTGTLTTAVVSNPIPPPLYTLRQTHVRARIGTWRAEGPRRVRHTLFSLGKEIIMVTEVTRRKTRQDVLILAAVFFVLYLLNWVTSS